MAQARIAALWDATALDNADGDPVKATGSYQQSAFVMLRGDGTVISTDRLSGFEKVLKPMPGGHCYTDGHADTVRVHLTSGMSYHEMVPNYFQPPTERTVTFLRRFRAVADNSNHLPTDCLTPDKHHHHLRPAQFRPGRHAASAQATRILAAYVTPAAALFVALIAWLVTGFALRPVEDIRVRMARIGAGEFHERVPVPPSGDGIARLAVTTNATLDKLDSALTEQRRLVADAAHELRSPIAVLRSSLEVALADGGTEPEWPEVVSGALTDTERLQALAEDLLLLADADRARSGERTVELQDLVAEQVAERMHGRPGPVGGPLIRVVEAQRATVRGNELRVGRLLRNLLDNAARHAVAEVTVSLLVVDGEAVLSVCDDGPGIPAADRERVFDRFVRLDDARDRAHGGAGLGLALVRAIAQGLGGGVTAEPPVSGRGARLVVRLPTHTLARTPPRSPVAVASPGRPGGP
ncbi:sensor histidine kinase [Streptacidiphilus sp. PAMC 29251]